VTTSGASNSSNTSFTFYLDWIVGAQFAGLLWASENGLYEANGLDVRLVPWHDDGRSVLDKVLDTASNGEVSAGCVEDNLIVSGAALGRPVGAFGAMLQDTPLVLMSRPEHGIQSIGDLRGKRIGMHPDGIRALEIVLALEGIPVADVKIHEVGFDLDHIRHDRFDAVQGYTMTEPVQLAALGVAVDTLAIKHPQLVPYAQVYVSERTLMMNNRTVFEGFLSASNAGWLSVCADPDRAASLVARLMGDLSQETEQRQMLERVIPLVLGRSGASQCGAINLEQWRKNLKTYANFGLIDQPMRVDEVVFDLQPPR
jgi:NitT/TauT family transport system substrate-binding protein